MPTTRVAPAKQIHHLPVVGLLSVVLLPFCGGHMTTAVQQQDEIQDTFNKGGQIVISQETSDLERPTSHVYVATSNVDALIRAIRLAKQKAKGEEG